MVKCTAVQRFALRQLPGTKGTKRTKRAWKFRKGIKERKIASEEPEDSKVQKKPGSLGSTKNPKASRKQKIFPLLTMGAC